MYDHETIARTATKYLYFPGITAFDSTAPDAAVDPTTLPVEMALLTPGVVPVEDDWSAGEWVDATTARVLIGPMDGIVKPPGEWVTWIRVRGGVEQPEEPVGVLVVT